MELTVEQADARNDDRIGRALDELFASDRTALLTDFVLRMVREFEVRLDELHNDSTSLTFQGDYKNADGRKVDGVPTHRITFGHSKDFRPDLKQLSWILTVSSDGAVPVHFKVDDGNVSDPTTHIETWNLLRQLVGSPKFLYVADCKLCTGDNLRYIDEQNGSFITVLPSNRKEDGWFREWVCRQDAEWQMITLIAHPNGKYWCTYEVVAATDEMRELGNLKLFEDNNLILTLSKVPGSDVEITNSGRLVFYDHSEHFKGTLIIHIYSKDGAFILSKEFERADQFAISPSGETMGVQASEGISIISLNSRNSYLIQKGLQFATDDGEEFVAVAQEGKILIYKKTFLVRTVQTGIELPRKIIVSKEHDLVGVIDKYNLKIYSHDSGSLLFEDKIGGDLSFRDLKTVDDKIVAGIHKRNKEESTGLFRVGAKTASVRTGARTAHTCGSRQSSGLIAAARGVAPMAAAGVSGPRL